MSNEEIKTIIPEEVIKLFLKELEIKKLYLLDLMSVGSVSLKYIADYFSFSRRKAKDFSKSFVNEVNLHHGGTTEYVKLLNDCIQYNDNLEQFEYIRINQEIRAGYIEKSSTYRFLIFILKNRKFNFNEITNNIFYSESYTYKLMTKVNILFSLLNLNLSIDKEDNNYFLKGEETTLRYLHYFTLSIVSKGSKYTEYNTHSQVTDFFLSTYNNKIKELSPVGKTRINYFSNIFSTSINSNNSLSPLAPEVLEVSPILEQLKENNKLFPLSNYSNINYFINELVSLDFLSSYFTQELKTDYEKSEQGKLFSKYKDNPIVIVCEGLLRRISTKYTLDSFTFNFMLYNLCINLVVIHYLKLHQFMHLRKNHYYGKVDTHFVEICIDLSLDQYKVPESYDKLKSNFYQIIVSEISLTPRIRIYIEFFHQPEYKSFIKNTLKKIYNNDLIEVIENYKDADVIISDTTGYESSEKEYYYFRNIFDKNSWIQLGQYLNSIVINDSLS